MGLAGFQRQDKDPAILDQVRVGDKVQFAADKVNGVLVTNLEAIKQ